jgi:uncharacterized membrane protein
MTLKEKPFIEAGARGMRPPDFFYSNPFVAGLLGTIVGAIIGFACGGVFASYYAAGDHEAWLNVARGGAGVVIVFSILVSAITALLNRGEGSNDRSQYFFGVAIASGLLIAGDRLYGDQIVELMDAVTRAQQDSSTLPRLPFLNPFAVAA